MKKSSLFIPFALALFTAPPCSAAILSYRVQGALNFISAGANVFPSAAIGSPVDIVFSIDTNASQSSPTAPRTFLVTGQTLSGTLGGVPLLMGGFLYGIGNGFLPGGGDMVDWSGERLAPVFPGGIGPTGGSGSLRFSDPTGSLLSNENMVTDPATLSAFPTATLSFTGIPGDFRSGSYAFTPTVTQIPEPASGLSLALGLLFLFRRRSLWVACRP